jgi:DNA-binding LacI/PurR family transcriptional regulator
VERLQTQKVAFVVGAAWEDIPASMANMVLDYMHGAANRLHRMEWDLCFFPLEIDTRMDITTPEIERLANFGGVIFEGETIACIKAIEFCLEKKIPVVALLPPGHLLRLPVMHFLPLTTVDYSRLDAGRKAAAYLMNCGFKSIGFIGEITGGDSKFMGFIRGLSERNVPLESRHIIEFSSLQSSEVNCGKLASLLETRNLPEAFFVDTDHKAMSVIDFLAARGLRVPDDVSILGYDDVSGAGDFRVPLTTVRIPRREIAAKAVETLFSLKKTPEKRIVPVEFSIIERSSVRSIVPPAGV